MRAIVDCPRLSACIRLQLAASAYIIADVVWHEPIDVPALIPDRPVPSPSRTAPLMATLHDGQDGRAGVATDVWVDEWTDRFGLHGKAVLTTVETAALLRICERSVREGIKEGWIPHVRLGRRVFVPVPRLVAMLAEPDDERRSG